MNARTSGFQSLRTTKTARDAIVEAMNHDNIDPTIRALLNIQMLIVEEIGEKLETILGDRDGLREAVLNGWEQYHHDHHEWIAKQIGDEKESKELAKDQMKAARKAFVESAIRWGIPAMLTAIAAFTAWGGK